MLSERRDVERLYRGTTITLAKDNDTVAFRALENNSQGVISEEESHFEMTGRIAASGDVTTLIKAKGVEAITTPNQLSYLFSGCTSLKAAPALPATQLAGYCYQSMFRSCTSLRATPALPATQLTGRCYLSIFENCTALTRAPALPAAQLTFNYYESMFEGCTGLLFYEEPRKGAVPWTIPDATPAVNWNKSMLEGTGGGFTSDPNVNYTYYFVPPSVAKTIDHATGDHINSYGDLNKAITAALASNYDVLVVADCTLASAVGLSGTDCLYIEGTGGVTVANAANADSMFTVSGNARLYVTNLTFVSAMKFGRFVTTGGGSGNRTLSLANVEVSGFRSPDDGNYGGAVYIDSNLQKDHLLLSDRIVVTNNFANDGNTVCNIYLSANDQLYTAELTADSSVGLTPEFWGEVLGDTVNADLQYDSAFLFDGDPWGMQVRQDRESNTLKMYEVTPTATILKADQSWPWNGKIWISAVVSNLNPTVAYALKIRLLDIVDGGKATNVYTYGTAWANLTGKTGTLGSVKIDAKSASEEGTTPPAKIFAQSPLLVPVLETAEPKTFEGPAYAGLSRLDTRDVITAALGETLGLTYSSSAFGDLIPSSPSVTVTVNGTDLPIEGPESFNFPWTPAEAGTYELAHTPGDLAATVYVLGPVDYLDWDDATKTMTNAVCTDYEIVTKTTDTFEDDCWYVVTGNVTRTTQIVVNGSAHLILADGTKLKVTGKSNNAGIEVAVVGSVTNSLAIYGQCTNETVMGKLEAKGGTYGAGIGGGKNGTGGTVTINGGTVTANCANYGAGIGGGYQCAGGVVTINGGTVTAKGGGGAGIGGGNNGAGGATTINGGTVTATGASGCAGIGGGNNGAGGVVTINGGTVTAKGGGYGAGIGGGNNGAGGATTINGGTVTATAGNYGAGIGGGYQGAGGDVIIAGGTVTATGDSYSAGIGSGKSGADPGTLKVTSDGLYVWASTNTPPEIALNPDGVAADLTVKLAVLRYYVVNDTPPVAKADGTGYATIAAALAVLDEPKAENLDEITVLDATAECPEGYAIEGDKLRGVITYSFVGQKDPLFYTGKSQPPVLTNCAETVCGTTCTFHYSSTEVGEYSTTPPEVKSVGIHTNYYYVSATGCISTAHKEYYVTVDMAPLTVTAEDREVVRGNPAPANAYKIDGLVDGESEADIQGQVAYDCDYDPANPGTAASFAITPKGLSSDNYAIVYSNGTLTVKNAACNDDTTYYETIAEAIATLDEPKNDHLDQIIIIDPDAELPDGYEITSQNKLIVTPAAKPLCLTAEAENSTVWLAHSNDFTAPMAFESSTDGVHWTQCPVGMEFTLADIGDKLYLRAATDVDQVISVSYYDFKYTQIVLEGKVAASGDVTTLLNRNGTDTVGECGLAGLFVSDDALTTAPELPATNLGDSCYLRMFYGCTSLTNPPALPATTLAENCYEEMFCNCEALTTAPELPATTLAAKCYSYMFYECTSLTTAPELPATTLAEKCYNYMFYECTSLTMPPVLPATTLAEECYHGMFYGCSSIRVYRVPGEGSTEWSLPADAAASAEELDWGSWLFEGNGGIVRGKIEFGRTYYIGGVPSPVCQIVLPDGEGVITNLYPSLEIAVSNEISTAESPIEMLADQELEPPFNGDSKNYGDINVKERDVYIDLAGHTLLGSGVGTIFFVDNDCKLTIVDTSAAKTGSLTGGEGADGANGGAIFAYSGSLALENITISNCWTISGGAILCYGPCSLKGCKITGCAAYMAAGVEISGDAYIEDCVIDDNITLEYDFEGLDEEDIPEIPDYSFTRDVLVEQTLTLAGANKLGKVATMSAVNIDPKGIDGTVVREFALVGGITETGFLFPGAVITSGYEYDTVKCFSLNKDCYDTSVSILFVNGDGELEIGGKFEVTYKAMGGQFADTAETLVKTQLVTEAYSQIGEIVPARKGYTFDGWFFSWTNGSEKVEIDTPFVFADHALYAHWTSVAPAPAGGTLSLPDVKNGQPNTVIGDKAYTQNKTITALYTPIYLQSIGTRAFYQNTNLKTLVIARPLNYADLSPGTLVIGKSAFAGCSFEELVIPDGVVLSAGAFVNNANLKRIYFLGNSAMQCDATAFERCGYKNGLDELKVYMSEEFRQNNPSIVADIQSKNTDITVRQLVGVSPVAAGTECTIGGIDFASLAADRKVAIAVNVATIVPNAVPESVTVKHSTDLATWQSLPVSSKVATGDGIVIVEVTIPEGGTHFFRVVVQ